MKLLKHLQVTSSTELSPCGKNSTNVHPSASQKSVPMVLWADGIVLASFS
jgi:hypothetical protein